MGVMHHEIGTHYIRKFNERLQPWFKNRKKFDLKPYLIVEEGLAALNQTLQTVRRRGNFVNNLNRVLEQESHLIYLMQLCIIILAICRVF